MEGYDAKFDPPLDKRLECPICLLAQREPMQTPCGHRFCSVCILRALSETGTRCPVDNTRVAVHQLFKDNFAKREVLSLHVHCHAEEHGCPWEGELRNLESHEKLCDLVSISCPYDCGHVCQRKSIISHLPLCSNHICPCSICSISYPQNKLTEHLQFCSKIKVPESVIESISKSNEVLKWCGHLKMKVHGQNYSAVGYLTAKADSEERFIYSGCWSSNISLIPLTGAASKLFWKTLQGPEVKPVELYFGILNVDSKSNNFQKLLKKKVNAVIGLRLKPSSRRELMIMYIHWSEQQKRLVAYVAELRNYLVREMQKKLQPLRRSSQFADFGQLSSEGGSRSTDDHQRGSGPSRRGGGTGGYGGSVRVINVPPTVPAVSIESHSHAPSVVPSILSWQLSPNFPTYPWRVQAGGPSVPFFTIPSTPPQFLPAHSYPYTFAPMPAIAAPPFSNIPIQPVHAPLTVPSYAGVTVPQVSGLHAELVVSSANNSTLQGGPPGGYIEGSGNNPPMPHIPAVIHSYTQDPATLSISHPVPAHPAVNQVSVVVDPRLNPQGGIVPPGDSRRAADIRQRQQQSDQQGHWPHHGDSNTTNNDVRPSTTNNRTQPSSASSRNTVSGTTESNDPSRYSTAQNRLHPSSNMPGPSGVNTQQQSSSSSSGSNGGSSNTNNTAVVVSSSDDESDSDIGSPFHWSIASSINSSPQHHVQYIDPPNDFTFSESGSPNSTTTRGSVDDRSPSSQQRAMGSALQTLADAAALLSSSPQSSSSSDDGNSDVMIIRPSHRPTVHNNNPSNTIQQPSSQRHQPNTQQHSSRTSTQHDPSQNVNYSTTAPPPTAAAIYQPNPPPNAGGVLTITATPQQTPNPNMYHHHPSQLAPGYHHPVTAPAHHAHLEELPVFLPVIHSSVDPQLEGEAVGTHPIPTGEGPPTAAVLYTPHDTTGGVVVTSRPLPMVDVPPLIRIAPQPNQRPVIPAGGEQWPIVEPQRTTQQVPSAQAPPPPPPANYIRPQPIVAATAPPPPNGGGFWEDVMPSLDMRLHETHTSMV